MQRKMVSQCLIPGLIVLSSVHQALADQPQLSVSLHEQGATVFEGTMPVLSYQAKTQSLDGRWQRADYVHPLYDLRGEAITEDFPDDHRHHRGIFWAWHQVLVGDKQLGDAWACRDFQWDVQSLASHLTGDQVSITAVTHWNSPALVDETSEPIDVVREEVRIVVHPKQTSHRVIDFHLSLLALVENLRIGGSDDEKGYGGFSPRLRMNGDEQFVSDSGSLEPETTAITAGTWVNITREQVGTAILVHRDNPQVTERNAKWILRRNRSMQNAVFPGRDTVAISTTEPTRLRYRLVVHDGSLTPKAIEGLQADFWASDSP